MASVTTAQARPAFSTGYRSWMLSLLVAIYACSFIDRIIVATVGQAIKVELKLSDFQFGLLGGMAFALFYAGLGIPIGRLAERKSRVTILAVCIALWSVMTALSGVATSYWQLLLFRTGVGVGEGGCSPAAHSLISDHYPPKKRASALAIYSIGVPIGSMLGAVAGGWVAETFSWRAAFVVVGLPGLLLALLARLTLREPPRGHSDGAAPPDRPPPAMAVVRRIASTATFRHVAAGFVLTNLAANGVAQFAPSYFVRAFGLGLAEVGLIYGVVSGASGVVGMLAGGFGTDFLARRDLRWYGWGPAIGALLACPVYLLAFSRGGPFSTAGFIFVGAFLYSLYFAPTMAIIQNLVEPRMRATASAIMLLMINIVGQGVGPTIMGLMSDLMGQGLFHAGDFKALCPGGVAAHGAAPALAQACIHASAAGLQRAILASTVFFVWGALHYVLAARRMKRDLGFAAAA